MLDAASSPAELTDPTAILTQAILLDQEGEAATARALMRSVAALRPDWDEPWLRIGQSLRRDGAPDEAIRAYDMALARNPARVEALLARGTLALGNQDPSGAVDLLCRATTIDPNCHEAWHALGYAYFARQLPEAALHALANAGRLAPDCFRYACDLTELAEQIGPSVAVTVPDWSDGVGLALAGRAARRRGDLDEAVDTLEAASALLPDEPWVLKELADVYLSALRPEAAEPVLREALRREPGNLTLLNDLGVCLGRQYRFGEAEAVLNRMRDTEQMSAVMLFNRAMMRASAGDLAGSCADIEIAKGRSTDVVAALIAECTLLPYRGGMTAATLRDAMTLLGNALPRPDRPAVHSRAVTQADRDRTLRVGLLSNTLRQHPVGWLTFAGFQALDPADFALHCFGKYDENDRFAQDFARHVAAWHSIASRDDAAIAALIADQQIDILIDLSGFCDGGRVAVLAQRAAPVQMKWVGSQASTTGVAEIDWMITDRWETPPGFEAFYTENLLRLADGYVCYMPPAAAPEVSALPALANAHITFGCFNNLAKLTDDTLRLWAAVLDRVPNARLTLRCPQFSEVNVRDRFPGRAQALGIDPSRLTLEGRAPHREFMAAYRGVDIALDPYPYSGGLTTCEAMFMGVPVITLAGDFFAARHSVSHLSNVGLFDCIATTPETYIDRAVSLAADLPALAHLRADLRRRMLASPLCDAPRFGRSLGTALRRVWHDHCDHHLVAHEPERA